jgi:heterodisulfide reductase subunit C
VFANRFMWVCSTHSSCQNRCPQGVNIKAIMYAIKTLALRHGYRSPEAGSPLPHAGVSHE